MKMMYRFFDNLKFQLRSRDPDLMFYARASEPTKELEELDLRKNDHQDISIEVNFLIS